MKYIIFQDANERRIPVIFSESLVHADVSELLKKYGRPISAGFVDFKQVQVYGMSESLGLTSNELDSARIQFGHSVEFADELLLRKLLVGLSNT